MRKFLKSRALRSEIGNARAAGNSIALVPTMGHLHAGHIKLMREAVQRADFVVASIYVNPTQFGPGEDLDAYPSAPKRDAMLLAEEGVKVLFTPGHGEIYPGNPDRQTMIEVPELGDRHCGEHRPGHFRGVASVVARLFNIVQPDFAVFGKKDYQQLAIIRRMVRDLAFPVEIIGVDTVRDDDGLALSSRNSYLSVEQREIAPALYQELNNVANKLIKGNESIKKIQNQAVATLRRTGFEPDYVAVCRQTDLEPAGADDRQLVVLAAARLGAARLIDNIEVELPA